MEQKSIQNKYWDELCQLRFDLFYINECIDISRKYDNFINIFTAITSSSSIGAWVIWRSLSFVWSCVIAVSQVINATKIYLPYSKRIRLLNEQYFELDKLFNDCDYLWFKIANGDFTEEGINDKLRDFRNRKHLIDYKYAKQVSIPDNKKISEKVMILTENYFS